METSMINNNCDKLNIIHEIDLIDYALAKQLVERDISICTDYGYVSFDMAEVKPIIEAARIVLKERLKKLQNNND